jgi:hypothetical protein
LISVERESSIQRRDQIVIPSSATLQKNSAHVFETPALFSFLLTTYRREIDIRSFGDMFDQGEEPWMGTMVC